MRRDPEPRPGALAAAIRRACGLRGDPPSVAEALVAECAQLDHLQQIDMLRHFSDELKRHSLTLDRRAKP